MFTTNASILPLSSTDDCTICHGGNNKRLLLLSLLSLEILIAVILDGVVIFLLSPFWQKSSRNTREYHSTNYSTEYIFARALFAGYQYRVPGTGSIRKKRRTGNGFLSPLPHYHINTTSCVTSTKHIRYFKIHMNFKFLDTVVKTEIRSNARERVDSRTSIVNKRN